MSTTEIAARVVGDVIGFAGLVGVFVFAFLYLRAPEGGDRRRQYALLAAVCAAVNAFAGLLEHNWFTVACGTVTAAIWLALWWRNRKSRRSPLSLGAKSRARIAAIVRKARENARPSPVRKPVLGGSR